MRKTFTILFFVQLCFVSLLHSAQDAKDTQQEFWSDWSGGLNTRDAAHKIGKQFSPYLSNVLGDERAGSFVERAGFVVQGTTGSLGKVNFLGEFVKDDGSRELILSDSVKVLSTKDFVDWKLLRDNQNTGALIHMAQGRNKAFFVNGVDPDWTYDGSTVSVLDGQVYSGTRAPNVPVGKYNAFYQDRFWVFNTTGNNSILYFSELTGTDGFKVDPFNYLAWPGYNNINVNLGDGFAGSGLNVYRGQLIAHKENRSIYTIFGEDIFTYTAKPTNSQTGAVSQDSIVQLDNLQYYISKDGIYAFNGSESERISDLITPDVQAIIGNQNNTVSNDWETQAEFTADNFSLGGATVTSSGLVTTLSTQTVAIINEAWDTSCLPCNNTNFITLNAVTTFYNYFSISTQTILQQNKYTGWISGITIKVQGINLGAFTTIPLEVLIKNFNNDSIDTHNISVEGANNVAITTTVVMATGCVVTSDDILNGNVRVQCRWLTGGANLLVSSPSSMGILLGNTTGQYISGISTTTSLTYWDKLISRSHTNGGTVNFFVKVATSPLNFATQTWTAVNDGAVFSFPAAKSYVQWCASITSVLANNAVPDYTQTANIDALSIYYGIGGGNDSRPIGIAWKNRFYLAVSTSGNGETTRIYVKSRITNSVPNAWFVFDGINIKSMCRFGDMFLAGSSTAGIVYRLDYGTNDNGNPITAIYETSDTFLGDLFNQKILNEYEIDAAQNTGTTFSIDTYVDGSLFGTKTVDLSGTKRLLKPIRNVAAKGKYFRFRFTNATYDKSFQFNTFGVKYQPTAYNE